MRSPSTSISRCGVGAATERSGCSVPTRGAAPSFSSGCTPQSLSTLSDVDACEVVAGLYRRLHVPALPQLRTLTSYLEQWTRDFEVLPRGAPIPHRLVEQAVSLGRELADVPAGSVVHGNLHYENVLAADREPWLAIAPRPMNGDPHYELAPMLWNRWDELSGQIRGGVQRRFYALVDAAGFDEERARAWVDRPGDPGGHPRAG